MSRLTRARRDRSGIDAAELECFTRLTRALAGDVQYRAIARAQVEYAVAVAGSGKHLDPLAANELGVLGAVLIAATTHTPCAPELVPKAGILC